MSSVLFHGGIGVKRHRPAFTVLELLVSIVVLMIILGIIFSITHHTGNAWKSTNSRIGAFQNARVAFEEMSSKLSQATLNTYWDYYDATGTRRTPDNAATFRPVSYGRYSDLHFVSGRHLIPEQVGHTVFFQTPAGYSNQGAYENLSSLLNACGYYVKYDGDSAIPGFVKNLPGYAGGKPRYRLLEFLQPSQDLAVFASGAPEDWFLKPLTSATPPSFQIAENVVALIVIPRNPQGSILAPDLEYDSRKGSTPTQTVKQSGMNHQLPPLVEIIMVAIDEPSAVRTCTSGVAPDFGLESLFLSAETVSADLETLEATLKGLRLTYRVFRLTVAMRNAKWSS